MTGLRMRGRDDKIGEHHAHYRTVTKVAYVNAQGTGVEEAGEIGLLPLSAVWDPLE